LWKCRAAAAASAAGVVDPTAARQRGGGGGERVGSSIEDEHARLRPRAAVRMEGACDRHATRNSGLGHAASIAPGSGAAVVVDFSSVRGAFSPHLTRFPGSTCGACASVCVCTFYKVGYTTLAVNVCVCVHFLESPLYSCSTTSLVDLLYSKCTRAMTFQNVFLSGVLEPRAVVGWYCVGAEGRVGPHLLGTLLARHNMLKSPLNLATFT
jgi:hypothetical protein